MDVNQVEDFYQHYRVEETLGQGMSSVVRRCARIAQPDSSWAVKTIDLQSGLAPESDLRQDARNEIAILKEVRHSQFVLQFEGAWESEGFFFILSELCPFGDLFTFTTEGGLMGEYRSVNVMRQLMEAIVFIHDRNIVHRDIKLENIFIASHRPFHIKLGDFGLATWTKTDSDLRDVVGTPTYFAPELLKVAYCDVEVEGYGRPIDVWACAVVMFMLLTGYEPFRTHQSAMRRRRVLKGAFQKSTPGWDQVTESNQQLVAAMLTVDPFRRPIAVELVKKMRYVSPETDVETKPRVCRFRAAVIAVMASSRLRHLAGQVIRADMLMTNPLSNKMLSKWINSATFCLYGHWVKREMRTAVEDLTQNEPLCTRACNRWERIPHFHRTSFSTECFAELVSP